MEKPPANRQQLAAAAVGKETAEADPHEAARQGVKQEATQKLLGGHGHEPFLVLMRVILPPECDLAVGEVHDPVIGDRHAMRIAGQIMKDVFGSSEWPFGVDHPVMAKQLPQKGMEELLLVE